MVDMKLEVLVLPVTDVDRARHFYEKLGFRLDADFDIGEDFRVVQVTPPGSEASVIFGKGVSDAAPGSVQGLHLIVTTSRRPMPTWSTAASTSATSSTTPAGSSTDPAPTAASPGPPRAGRLRLLRLLHRPRRQRLGAPGGRHPGTRPMTCHQRVDRQPATVTGSLEPRRRS